jgi:YVTN family beta-propeller protein
MGAGLLSILIALSALGTEPDARTEAHRRRPVALALSVDGRFLYAGNRESGTISIIQVATRQVIAEPKVGLGVTDLAITPDGHNLLAIDGPSARVILLKIGSDALDIGSTRKIPPDPVRLSLSNDGSRAAVASRWSNTVTIVAIGQDEIRPQTRTIALPFAPRQLIWIDDKVHLAIADAFGGKLAVVNADRGTVESVRTLPSHNIGGLAMSPDRSRLIITQQFLNHRSETTADSIHWGFLLTNSLRSLRVSDLLTPDTDLVPTSRLAHLGEPGNGAGDPSGLAILPDGQIVTALAGVGQIAIGRLETPDARRIGVGARPTAVVLARDGRTAYVANTLDDTVSVVDLRAGTSTTIALGPKPPEREIDLGERLFYDARLSHEGWMSCQSCHGDGHAIGRRADTLGDGTFGDPKEVLSLLGVADTPPYGWNGHMPDLESQVRKSIKTTMRSAAQTDAQVRALATFLRTLPPPPPMSGLKATAVARGRAIFEQRRCDRCHLPPTYTTPRSEDVGLVDESGNARFNPPSLRGVGRRGPYFHDGRAERLEDVFTQFGHPRASAYNERDAADLVEFLRSL